MCRAISQALRRTRRRQPALLNHHYFYYRGITRTCKTTTTLLLVWDHKIKGFELVRVVRYQVLQQSVVVRCSPPASSASYRNVYYVCTAVFINDCLRCSAQRRTGRRVYVHRRCTQDVSLPTPTRSGSGTIDYRRCRIAFAAAVSHSLELMSTETRNDATTRKCGKK